MIPFAIRSLGFCLAFTTPLLADEPPGRSAKDAAAETTAPAVTTNSSAASPSTAGSSIEFGGVVTLVDQVELPSNEAGVIEEIQAKPGQMVSVGAPVAKLRDEDVRLLFERTRSEADIALKKFESDLDETYAKKTTDVARAELNRSLESNARYAKSVSQTDLDRLRLMVEQGEIETRRAEQERAIAGLQRDIAENEHQVARHKLELRRIATPIPGMVVEVLRRRGEWVQPGDVVARIIRLDRLRIEGFLPAEQGPLSLLGRAVQVVTKDDEGATIELDGEISFVSPEVDPINSQVRVWAEFDNPKLLVRPGTSAVAKVAKP
jgi:macrolide-specific efflux system membrane fusion protein